MNDVRDYMLYDISSINVSVCGSQTLRKWAFYVLNYLDVSLLAQ